MQSTHTQNDNQNQNRDTYPGYTYPTIIHRPSRVVPIPGSIRDINHPNQYLQLHVQYRWIEDSFHTVEPTAPLHPWPDDPPPYEAPIDMGIGQVMDANASEDRRSLAFERLSTNENDGPRALRIRLTADDALRLDPILNGRSNGRPAWTLQSRVKDLFDSVQLNIHRNVADIGQNAFYATKLSRRRWEYLCDLAGHDRALTCRLVYQKDEEKMKIDCLVLSRYSYEAMPHVDYDLYFDLGKETLGWKLKDITERLRKKMRLE